MGAVFFLGLLLNASSDALKVFAADAGALVAFMLAPESAQLVHVCFASLIVSVTFCSCAACTGISSESFCKTFALMSDSLTSDLKSRNGDFSVSIPNAQLALGFF